MSAPTQDYDPLMGAVKRPAVSFKNAPVGTVKRLVVRSLSREAQQTDFDTGKPAFWPSDIPGQQGNPKMAVVFDVFDETAGEERALWCPKPSSMLTAVATAQTQAGVRIAPGGVLEVKFVEQKPSQDRKKEGQKVYAAKYTPPAPADALADSTGGAPAATDPWSSTPTTGDAPPF